LSIVAIGNFDGLHLGHQALLKKVVQISKSEGQTSIAYTFTPHPRNAPRLMSDTQKAAGIRALGLQQVVFQEFTLEFASLTPQQFIDQVLIGQLKASQVIIGPNFAFGSGAKGDTRTLQQDTRFKTHIVAPVWVDSELCSSSLIRAAIAQGNLEKAERLLGRAYSLTGKVIEGAKRGAQLGFPTANLATEQEVLPPLGVYATHSKTLGLAATNIGKRPTFGQESVTYVETHFLNFDGDLYGQELEIFFDKKIRDEQKFESAEDLKKQIARDLKAVLSQSSQTT